MLIAVGVLIIIVELVQVTAPGGRKGDLYGAMFGCLVVLAGVTGL